MSLPATFANRDRLQARIFNSLLFTLLMLETTIRSLLRTLGPVRRKDGDLQEARRHGQYRRIEVGH